MLKLIRFLKSRKDEEKKKALIICFPRTGSTTISHCLRLHPDIRLAGEVFNKTNPKFSEIVYSIDDFYKNVYNHFNVFQLKYTNLGDSNFIALLRKKNYLVQVLYRKNSFEKVISSHIGRKLGVWYSVEGLKEIEPFYIDPLKIKKTLLTYQNDLKTLKGILDSLGIPYRVMAYEEIFSPEVNITERIEIYFNLVTYFGFDPDNVKDKVDRIIELLSDSRKINNSTSYAYIKNYQELVDCYGNELVSWEQI